MDQVRERLRLSLLDGDCPDHLHVVLPRSLWKLLPLHLHHEQIIVREAKEDAVMDTNSNLSLSCLVLINVVFTVIFLRKFTLCSNLLPRHVTFNNEKWHVIILSYLHNTGFHAEIVQVETRHVVHLAILI